MRLAGVINTNAGLLSFTTGLPKAIRKDNSKEFCGREMMAWAHLHGVALTFIESKRPHRIL